MDINELMAQLANNPQLAAQFGQILQAGMMFPQRGNQMNNWNMPTNPMAAMWINNLATALNNAQNNSQQNQNPQQPTQKPKETETDSGVSLVRVIKSPNEIKPDEILMNGNISLFLQDDMSIIYGKRWTNDGILENIRFIREVDNSQEIPDRTNTTLNNQEFNQEELMQNIATLIDGKLEEFKKEYPSDKSKTTNQSNNKKGA